MTTHEEFRSVIRSERDNLTRLSDYWNSQITNSDKTIPKDLQGRIRAAVGKTRLLLSEKFKQFEGLVEQSENNTAEKEISLNDLQGFWDLVLIQVNEVKEMFRGLESPTERGNLDNRRVGRSKSKEVELTQRDSKKKSSYEFLEQTMETNEKDMFRSEDEELQKEISLSKV